MTFYITPKNNPTGQVKPVISCVSQEEVSRAIKRLSRDGWGDEYECVRGDVVCDFCSTPEIVQLYSITPGAFMFGAFAGTDSEGHIDSDGVWGACTVCHALLQARKWDALYARSMDAAAEHMAGLPLPVVEMSITAAHNVFKRGWDELGNPDPKPVQTDAEFLEGFQDV